MESRRKSPGRPVWIALGAAAAFLLVFSIYIQFNALQNARQELIDETAALESTRARLRQMEQVKAQKESMRQQLAYYSKQVPDAPGEEDLINDMQNYAAMSGMQLRQVRFQERVGKENYVEMPFHVELEGDYYGFVHLLARLQNSERALRVSEFRLSKDSSNLLRADIYGCAFYASGSDDA